MGMKNKSCNHNS